MNLYFFKKYANIKLIKIFNTVWDLKFSWRWRWGVTPCRFVILNYIRHGHELIQNSNVTNELKMTSEKSVVYFYYNIPECHISTGNMFIQNFIKISKWVKCKLLRKTDIDNIYSVPNNNISCTCEVAVIFTRILTFLRIQFEVRTSSGHCLSYNTFNFNT